MDKSDLMSRQILRVITLACSVFCEYLVADSDRVKNAGFSAMRLILSHGLKPRFFQQKPSKKTESEKMLELLNFDALSLSAEVEKTRSG